MLRTCWTLAKSVPVILAANELLVGVYVPGAHPHTLTVLLRRTFPHPSAALVPTAKVVYQSPHTGTLAYGYILGVAGDTRPDNGRVLGSGEVWLEAAESDPHPFSGPLPTEMVLGRPIG